MSQISKEQITHLAALSRLDLSDNEMETFSNEISGILEYVQLLNKVDTNNVEPTLQITGLKNIAVEDDIYEPQVSREELLKNAPETQDGFIKVKPVFEERGDI